MSKSYVAALTALSLLVATSARADYVIKDGQSTPAQQTFGSFSLSGVQFPKHVMVDPTTGAAIGVASNPMAVQVANFPATTQVGGSVAVTALPALPAGTNGIGSVVVSALPVLPAGTNAIGSVSVTSLPPLPAGTNAIGSVAVSALPALPAGTNTIGSVLSNLQIGGAAVATGNPVPVSQASVPPGAATSAKQPALGTAGTPSADVLSMQGVTGGTPLTADTVVRSTSADRGGTITTGGTAQQFMAANTVRRGFTVQNQSTGDLYINCLTTAAIGPSSLRVPAGALYESSPHHSGTGACSIIGATTAQAFYAREF